MLPRMKKIVTLFLVMAMILITASCSAGNESSGKPHGNETANNGNQNTDEQKQEPSSDSKYKEAPELAELVAKGELPPVEERLPEEPCVVEVSEEGKYGGSYAGGGFGPSHGQLDTEGLRFVGLLQIEPDLQTFTPSILKDYEISSDFKEYTWYLRKGMKWSDGHPFTADDFMFFYEDILLNEELTPAIADAYKAGGEVMKMEKIDDYTIKITFKEPYPAFEVVMAKSFWTRLYAPKHYLQKWHIKYNEKANELAKEEGYESWFQAFNYHLDDSQAQQDTERPNITPWVLYKIDEVGNKYYKRNPYYWKVDQFGNQLPYIEEQRVVLVQDSEMRIMKLISGELHAAAENPLPVKDYPLYKENESKGQYKVYLFNNTRGSDCAVVFNLTTKNQDLRPIFNDIRFRQAMSLAIDRQKINDTLYLGKAKVRQAAMPSVTSFFEEWMETYYAEYDPDKAGQLLDEIGLKWNADKTARLLPNGKPIRIILETTEEFIPMCEIVAEDWTKIGVETILKQQERSFFQERVPANEVECSAFTYDSVHEFNLRTGTVNLLPPFNSITLTVAPLWNDWVNSNGQKGEEPPAEILDLRERVLKIMGLEAGSEEYMELGKSIASDMVKGLYFIGTTVAPRVVIISEKLGNTPTEGTFATDYGFWYPYKGDTWYFK